MKSARHQYINLGIRTQSKRPPCIPLRRFLIRIAQCLDWRKSAIIICTWPDFFLFKFCIRVCRMNIFFIFGYYWLCSNNRFEMLRNCAFVVVASADNQQFILDIFAVLCIGANRKWEYSRIRLTWTTIFVFLLFMHFNQDFNTARSRFAQRSVWN